MVTYKISNQFDFPFKIYESLVNANSKQYLLLYWDNNINQERGKPWIQIVW